FRGRDRHALERRRAVGLIAVHLMVGTQCGGPLRMLRDDRARVRVGQEAVANRWRGANVGDFGEPARDEGRGEGADRSQLGQAAVSGDEGARLLGPHERRSGGAAERALLTPFAALAFACEQLCDISVGERLQGRRGASTFTTGSTRWLVEVLLDVRHTKSPPTRVRVFSTTPKAGGLRCTVPPAPRRCRASICCARQTVLA